jgi:hypothetical protein
VIITRYAARRSAGRVAHSVTTALPMLGALFFFLFPAQAADPPKLVVLPLELMDTSGEIPPHTEEHVKRLAALTDYLAATIARHKAYDVLDPAPIRDEIVKTRKDQSLYNCNGCERTLAAHLHADRVLIGEVYKVSTLLGSMRLNIIDVATGRSVFHRSLDFRGDTDDAWQHAARFFVRDLEATPPEQR